MSANALLIPAIAQPAGANRARPRQRRWRVRDNAGWHSISVGTFALEWLGDDRRSWRARRVQAHSPFGSPEIAVAELEAAAIPSSVSSRGGVVSGAWRSGQLVLNSS